MLIKEKTSSGFTIVELIMAVSVSAVLMFIITSLLVGLISNPHQSMLSLSNIDQARNITTTFSNELRNSNIGNDGSYALNSAGTSQIIFYSSLGCQGTIVNRIRYFLSGNTLYKGIIVPTGSPLAYNINSEKITTLMTNLANTASPIFYYYDGNYNGNYSQLAPPFSNIQVEFVKINLTVPNTITANDKTTFLVSGGAAIRSLKNNLGS